MHNNKKGFTLSEVLVTLTIIGIIMVLSVNSIKIVKESYVSLAYFAFKNLQTAVTFLFSGSTDILIIDKTSTDDSKIHKLTKTTTINGTVMEVFKPDEDVYNTGYDYQNLFCKGLASISNTSGSIDCDNLFRSTMCENKYGYFEPCITIDDLNSPNFITTNGQRYYVSKWVEPDPDDEKSISNDFGYRLVAIDLNGKSKPNTQTESRPDIVTFLVLDNGEVFPLGVAADNLTITSGSDSKNYRYLTVRLKGYYFSAPQNGNTNNIPSECTRSTGEQICNFRVGFVPYDDSDSIPEEKKRYLLSYREAYCKSVDDSNLKYSGYCENIEHYKRCPIATDNSAFDLCKVDIIKPAFRFNFQ